MNRLTNLKQSEFQRNYLWELWLPDFAGISGVDMIKYCQSISFGQYDVTDFIKIRYGSQKRSFVGFIDIKEIEATFLKPVYNDIVTAYFKAWREKMFSDTGYYGVKGEYSRDAYIKLFFSNGHEVLTYKLSGVFPKNFPAFDLDYKKEGLVEYNISFNVDRIEIV